MYKTNTKNRANQLRATSFAIAKLRDQQLCIWGAIEKSPILLSQYWKQGEIGNKQKIILQFWA